MEDPLILGGDQQDLWDDGQQLVCFPAVYPKPRRKAPPPPATGPFRDQWDYLKEWFALSAEIGRGIHRKDPADEPLRRLPALLDRSAVSRNEGVDLPVESFVLRHGLDLVDRLLLVALLREALRLASDGGVVLCHLMNAAGVEGLEKCETVRARLESKGTLRSKGFLECNQDPVPSHRLYRLPPALLPHLVPSRPPAAVPGTTESEAVDFLCRHVGEVQRILAGESRSDTLPWRMAPREGPGWSESRAAVEELASAIQSLASAKRGDISDFFLSLEAQFEQQALGALLIHDARRGLGGVPASQALGFVSLVSGCRQSALLFAGPDSFAEERFCEVLPGRNGEPGLVRLTDAAAKDLVPGAAVSRRMAERSEEEVQAPFDLVRPTTRLDDVVLPEALRAELDDALALLRSRDVLFGEWGFRSPSYAGNGAILLFEGPPGTGKTYAAEAIAGELGRPLCRIRIDQLHSKWHGETEKQIAAAFRAAEKENAVLLFDEADAVVSARDGCSQNWEVRHINILLQEVERFPGIALFTTNRPAVLDPGLERRLAARLAFPLPGLVERVALWLAHLPEKAPRAKDVDLVALSRHFPLTGSQIRTAALHAASAAARRDGPARVIRQADLRLAAARVAKKDDRPEGRAVGF
ncbi:MAG TPA: ATP-binding protein [Thermoanaerobaculia bacterium]|nr:ATP-binding protein [Thermoanaerobaculia bacterium]